MTYHVALLRAVNVGGRKVSMSALAAMFTKLGLAETRTLLQSGNVVFKSEGASTAELESLLEKTTERELNIRTAYFVRTARELQAVVERNPFTDEARTDPSHLLVVFLKKAPAAKGVQALQAAIKGREVVKTSGKHAYIVYPDGIGDSKLTNAVIDSRLATSGTGRNWNTVRKLLALTCA